MTKLLYIHSTVVPPDQDEQKILFYHISDRHEGDVIQPVWGKCGPTKHRTEAGRFRYHFTYSRSLPRVLRVPWQLMFFVITGLWLHYVRRRSYDVIMSYSWETTGIAALILKWLTRAKLILFVPNSPEINFLVITRSPGLALRVRSRLSQECLRRVLKHCDGLWLCYPGQVDAYDPPRDIPMGAFPNYVPVCRLTPSDDDERYVLLVGYPWYLKGVDLLIRAFKQIANEFPQYRLRILGYCPDRSYFEELRDGDPRIEFHAPVLHEEALRQIAACAVFVLPSRSEGMARVLSEAMALRKPIITSRVGGSPHYIQDGVSGLLIESENVDQLVCALRRVLGDQEFARRLAQGGYELVHDRFNEKCFAGNFHTLIQSVLHGKSTAEVGAQPSESDCVAPLGCDR